MSKIYDAKLPREQAQTHVLIIGVNDYPHLPGGAKYDEWPTKHFGLEQLTSPVVSAQALADWLLTSHYNPDVPLGSIELLLSPAMYTPSDSAAAKLLSAPGSSIPVEPAELAAIKIATGRWYQQSNQHRDNIALFYFCGHGLEASDRYLLPSDYGANPLNWTDNLINFTVTHLNMQGCRAKTQCFFLDACRDKPGELQIAAATNKMGQVLIGPQLGSSLNRDAPIFHAAAPGKSAAGAPWQTSYFTQALLACLNGMGSRYPDGEYAPVDHESLGTALKELIARETTLKLQCDMDGPSNLQSAVDLHLAPMPVKVLTSILCQPLEAHEAARISVTDVTGEYISRETTDKNPWKLAMTAGKCTLRAEFDSMALYQDIEIEDIAFPPLFRRKIKVQRQP
jgi:Caspase domain